MFGFSYIGLIYLLMLGIPNLIWMKHLPMGYVARKEQKRLRVFEQCGQVSLTCCVLIFKDFNIVYPFTIWSLWLLASFLIMLVYEGYWIHYFKGEQTLVSFYRRYAFIPVAGATLPVIAFFLLGIYGQNIWLMLASIVFGIGHIGIHLQHAKEIEDEQSRSKNKGT